MSGATPAPDDVAEMLRLRELSEKATPGRWYWWTSNSWLRLGTDAQGYDQNGVSYGQDGYVAYPYVSRSDKHPDLCIRNAADQDLIVAAVNYVRAIFASPAGPAPPQAVPDGVWLNSLYGAADNARLVYLRDIDANDQMGGIVAAVDAVLDEQAKLARRLDAVMEAMGKALEEIATSRHQAYTNDPFISDHDSGYKMGVADGHRFCASVATDALAAFRALRAGGGDG